MCGCELDGADADLSEVGCYDPVVNPNVVAYESFTGLADGPHVLRVQARSTRRGRRSAAGARLHGGDGVVGDGGGDVGSGGGVDDRVVVGGVLVRGAGGGVCAGASSMGPTTICRRWVATTRWSTRTGSRTSPSRAWPMGRTCCGCRRGRPAGPMGPVLEHAFTVETASLATVEVTSGPGAGSTIASSWAAFSFAAPAAACVRVRARWGRRRSVGGGLLRPGGQPERVLVRVLHGPGRWAARVAGAGACRRAGPMVRCSSTPSRSRAGPLPHVSSRPRQVLPTGCCRLRVQRRRRPRACGWSWTGRTPICRTWVATTRWRNPNGYSYQSFTGLADGPHTFRVQARSSGGSFGPVVETTFVVETKDPETTIVDRPADVVGDDRADVHVHRRRAVDLRVPARRGGDVHRLPDAVDADGSGPGSAHGGGPRRRRLRQRRRHARHLDLERRHRRTRR